jgi:cyclic pyranopterin phosphate synthase
MTLHNAELIDSYGRKLDYVRISVTDRCNFRCTYCMPPEGVECIPHSEILRYEDIKFLCSVLADLGVNKIRITGGEPLVRRGLVSFLKELRLAMPAMKIALTTNGSLLAENATGLFESGINSLNISLDTIDAEKFSQITRGGNLQNVIKGIDSVINSGIENIKLNTVLIKGFNDSEIDNILEFANSRNIIPRLIEFMPLEKGIWSNDSFISAMDVLKCISDGGAWHLFEGKYGYGPADYYKNDKSGRIIGVITAVSQHFCANCNRIRVSSSGAMRMCLFSPVETQLRETIRSCDAEKLREMILNCAKDKPRSWSDVRNGHNHMSSIGG